MTERRNRWLPDTRRVLIIGAGGLGRGVAAWVRHAVADQRDSNPSIRFVDDNPDATARFDAAPPVACSIDSYEPAEGDAVIVALGMPQPREAAVRRLQDRGANFVTLVHPTAILGDRVSIGAGGIICPQAVIDSDATLGRFAVVNLMSSVDHDVALGDFASLSCHVDLTGGVAAGRGVFFGSRASVLPGVSVGDRAIVGAGAVVNRDVRAGATVVGVPAREISVAKAA